MKTALFQYKDGRLTKHKNSDEFDVAQSDLVLCFGAKQLLSTDTFNLFKSMFPKADIAMCSTAGEIYGTEVFDDTISITASLFTKTKIASHSININDYADSFSAGKAITALFAPEDLSHLFIISEGSLVNGSELVRGINNSIHHGIIATGGLAGDSDKFASTLVGLNGPPTKGLIAGIGFYGKNVLINHGSQGGWETFGLERIVTKSSGNILYEIDNKNALELYKKYLGNEAQSLPGSALLFPLSVKLNDTDEEVVRTILSINEAEGSMTFAGDVPQGSQVRFMKANFDKVTNAASIAALQTRTGKKAPPKLALLISCVGRKLILQSRTDEEVEAVSEAFDNKTLLAGFYSYGEISPITKGAACQLHNQTMTITTFDEVE